MPGDWTKDGLMAGCGENSLDWDTLTTPCWDNSTDTANCYRMLRSAGEHLVLASHDTIGKGADHAMKSGHVDVYAVSEAGLLSKADAGRLLISTAREYLASLADAHLDSKEFGACSGHARRLQDAGAMDKIERQMPAVLSDLVHLGLETEAEMVPSSRIDGDLSVVGTPSGALDLRTGLILPPDDARRRLIASSIPDRYNPTARHPWVDEILPPVDVCERLAADKDPWPLYRGRATADSMLHPPRRKLLLELCAAGSGKTTYTNALKRGFGSAYVTGLRPEVLMKAPEGRAATGGTAHNGDFRHLMPPARIAFVQEWQGDADVKLLKKISGGDDLEYRRIREEDTVGHPSATLWVQGNNSGHLGLSDDDDSGDAMRDRIRILHRERREAAGLIVDPRIADYGLDSLELCPGDACRFRQAVVARVVEYCIAWGDAGFPESLETQTELLRAQADRELLPYQRWLRDVVQRAPGQSFTSSDLWDAYHGWKSDDDPDFKTSSNLIAELRKVKPGFPERGVRRNSPSGRKLTDYPGWSLA